MKYPVLFTVLLISSCTTTTEMEISKKWLGKEVNFDRIKETVHVYHMFDTTESKVGSMSFGWKFENGMLVSRDTSQFDDGSVYETAVFEFDTSTFEISKVAIDMEMGATSIDMDFSNVDNRVNGVAKMQRDTLVREFPVDSVYNQDVFREELYMLMHTLDYKKGDSIPLSVFVPSGMGVSKASITYVGEEQLELSSGIFDCTVILLVSSGGMPTNKIWINKQEPGQIVKFYVPGPELSIEWVK